MFYDQTALISAPEIWTKLTNQFSIKANLRKGTAITQFMNFRFSKSKTVEQNLQMFNTLSTNLSESGVTLEQEVKVGQLLTPTKLGSPKNGVGCTD